MKSVPALLLIAVLMLPVLSFAQGSMGGQALVSPVIASDHRVTFRLRAPQANEVSVSGLPTPLPMVKDSQGVWSATTESALAPDIYTYGFVVDGVRSWVASIFSGSLRMFSMPAICLRYHGELWVS